MGRDLFSEVFSRFSQYESGEYQELFVNRLPLLLLGAATQESPSIRSIPGYAELRDEIEGNAKAHCTNPEIFPHLHALRICPSERHRFHIDCLRVHVGISTPTPRTLGNHRYLRLHFPKPQILAVRKSELAEVDGVLIDGLGALSFPLAYAPHPQLFCDVAGTIYKGGGAKPAASESLLRNYLLQAIGEMRAFSGELASAFCSDVSCVAFTADRLSYRRSYSMRMDFPGGIFTAVCSPPALVENLIHEHCHLRFWRWWMLEKPSDLISSKKLIRSPVSRYVRSVPVMLQALLIYCVAIDFYRWRIGSPSVLSVISRPLRQVCRARLTRLEESTVLLARQLRTALNESPRSLAMLAVIIDSLESIVGAPVRKVRHGARFCPRAKKARFDARSRTRRGGEGH